jgi:hypothetical protein
MIEKMFLPFAAERINGADIITAKYPFSNIPAFKTNEFYFDI